jgi:hypothetical protein
MMRLLEQKADLGLGAKGLTLILHQYVPSCFNPPQPSIFIGFHHRPSGLVLHDVVASIDEMDSNHGGF